MNIEISHTREHKKAADALFAVRQDMLFTNLLSAVALLSTVVYVERFF